MAHESPCILTFATYSDHLLFQSPLHPVYSSYRNDLSAPRTYLVVFALSVPSAHNAHVMAGSPLSF